MSARETQLWCKDVCKRDMKALDTNTKSWEDLAADHMMWRSALNEHLKAGENKAGECRSTKKGLQKEAQQPKQTRPHTNATFAAEIVSPTSVSTATSDAATIKQTG